MKAHEVIADSLSEWRTVTNIPDLARQEFDRLDNDEVTRLAIAGLAAEYRKAFTRKTNGVPAYSSVDVIERTGRKVKRYKQTEPFDVDDFRVAVQSYRARSQENTRVAQALVVACQERFGVQLGFGEAESA